MSEHQESTAETYDEFLRKAIHRYWEQDSNRANFIAILLASREAWEVAWDEVTKPGSGKKLLTGAAGVTAAVVVLRTLLGGPIGLVLTGASVASLGALYVRNHKHIWAQQERYKLMLNVYRVKHQQIRTKYVDGTIDADERDLMLDGLMQRFLQELDEEPESTSNDGSTSDLGSNDDSEA